MSVLVDEVRSSAGVTGIWGDSLSSSSLSLLVSSSKKVSWIGGYTNVGCFG